MRGWGGTYWHLVALTGTCQQKPLICRHVVSNLGWHVPPGGCVCGVLLIRKALTTTLCRSSLVMNTHTHPHLVPAVPPVPAHKMPANPTKTWHVPPQCHPVPAPPTTDDHGTAL